MKQQAANIKKSPSLLFCIVMDFIGFFSYAIPFIGEISDVVWAPVSAFIYYISFGGKKGIVGGVFNFIEEVFPGTDFIPTFTLTWFLQNKNLKTAK